jgi:transposase
MAELNPTKRVHEGIKDIRFKRQSIVSTVRLNGEKVAFVFEGTLNKELFSEYLRVCLAPSFGEGDVLVLDNSSVHTSKLVREVLVELGISVLFLPTYSPDFNPVEFMWAYVKGVLRKLKARTEEALVDAAVVALECVTPEFVASWFKHCNYTLPT